MQHKFAWSITDKYLEMDQAQVVSNASWVGSQSEKGEKRYIYNSTRSELRSFLEWPSGVGPFQESR